MIVTADHETGGLAITMGKTKGYEIVAVGLILGDIALQLWSLFLIWKIFRAFQEESMTIPKYSAIY